MIGPFMNDKEEYVGGRAPPTLAQAQNDIIMRLLCHPALAELHNIQRRPDLEKQVFALEDASPERADLKVFLSGKSNIWAKRSRFGERLTDQSGRPMVRGIQYAPETLRPCADYFQGRLVGPENRYFGEWRGFVSLPGLNSRFGEVNVTMMMRTIRYPLPECLWGLKDTPIRLHDCEELLLASLPEGRYEKVFAITTVTANLDEHPSGMRYKVHSRPTAFGMYDMGDIMKLFDGVRDQYGNGPTVEMLRSLVYLSCIKENAMGRDVHDPSVFVGMEGCRYMTEKDAESEYVIPVMMEFKNCFYEPGPAYDKMRLHSVLPIGMMVPLKKCPFYDLSIIGPDVRWFNFQHMQQVYPQPILEASDKSETAKGFLQPGQKILALSVGRSTFHGSLG